MYTDLIEGELRLDGTELDARNFQSRDSQNTPAAQNQELPPLLSQSGFLLLGGSYRVYSLDTMLHQVGDRVKISSERNRLKLQHGP